MKYPVEDYDHNPNDSLQKLTQIFMVLLNCIDSSITNLGMIVQIIESILLPLWRTLSGVKSRNSYVTYR